MLLGSIMIFAYDGKIALKFDVSRLVDLPKFFFKFTNFLTNQLISMQIQPNLAKILNKI